MYYINICVFSPRCSLFSQNVLYFLKMFFIYSKCSLFSLNVLYLWVGILFFSIWFHMWHPWKPNFYNIYISTWVCSKSKTLPLSTKYPNHSTWNIIHKTYYLSFNSNDILLVPLQIWSVHKKNYINETINNIINYHIIEEN